MKVKKIIFDTETTGTDSVIHGIHQLSGIIEVNGVIIQRFDLNIKPFEGAIIDPKALETSHVTEEQIMQYEEESVIFERISNVLKTHIDIFDKKDKFFLVGWNVKFDVDMLKEFFRRNTNDDMMLFGSMFWSNTIDLMSIASDYLMEARPFMKNFKLLTVADKLRIKVDGEENYHNAMYDVEVTYGLMKFFEDIRNKTYKIEGDPIFVFENSSNVLKNVLVDLGIEEYLIELSQGKIKLGEEKETKPNIAIESRKTENYIDSLRHIMFFGKHKGKTIREIIDIDASYIIWLRVNTDWWFSDEIIALVFENQELQKQAYEKAKASEHQRDFDSKAEHIIKTAEYNRNNKLGHSDVNTPENSLPFGGGANIPNDDLPF